MQDFLTGVSLLEFAHITFFEKMCPEQIAAAPKDSQTEAETNRTTVNLHMIQYGATR